jgi:hypothetical protein
MRRHAGNVGRMGMPRLLNLLRQDWWLLAIVICIAWAIEGVIEGNTFREIMIGPVMVILWAGAIFVIDRWVVRIPDQKGTRPPGWLMGRRRRNRRRGKEALGIATWALYVSVIAGAITGIRNRVRIVGADAGVAAAALRIRMAIRVALVFRADIVGKGRDGAQNDTEQ